MNPFKKKQPRISREIEEMAESLKRISEKLDILLKDIKINFDVVSYKDFDYPARYVDVPYVHEDGEEEINSYTVIDSNLASIIQQGIDNEDEEAKSWNYVLWWSLTPEEFKSLSDDELIREIQAMNGNLEDRGVIQNGEVIQ